jgi:hypothetical protein
MLFSCGDVKRNLVGTAHARHDLAAAPFVIPLTCTKHSQLYAGETSMLPSDVKKMPNAQYPALGPLAN